MLPQSFYRQPAIDLAPALLGCELIYNGAVGECGGVIVEVEAYTRDDPASHSFIGPTKRNQVIFGPAGHAYVYFTYGMHYCVNVVGGEEGTAEAVLIRALQPTRGIALMEQRRKTVDPFNLCSGPAKLAQALGISINDNGKRLDQPTFYVKPRPSHPRIMSGPRIGIRKAVEQPWRFFIAGNLHVTSHRFNKLSVPLIYE